MQIRSASSSGNDTDGYTSVYNSWREVVTVAKSASSTGGLN